MTEDRIDVLGEYRIVAKGISENHSKEAPPVNILHSIDRWLPQTAPWLYFQVKYLPPHISSHIICRYTDNLDQFSLPNIVPFDRAPALKKLWDKLLRWLKLRDYCWDLVPYARKVDARLLHSHFGSIGWQNISGAKKAGISHVVTFYGFDVNFLPRQSPKWSHRYLSLFKSVDRVLCEGNHMAKCIEKLGCPARKITVHHLGIQVDEIEFKPRSWDKKACFKILIAATFREKKGISYALEALGKMKDKLNFSVTVIGGETMEERSREEGERIRQVVKKYALETRVRFLGFQPHTVFLKEAYNHHLFLSPSITAKDGDTEGGAPVSLIEVAATGMPIVSSFHCDIPEIIHNRQTGLLSEEKDVAGIVKNIEWYTENVEKWEAMVCNGRKHIEKNYDARIQGKKLYDIYQDVWQD